MILTQTTRYLLIIVYINLVLLLVVFIYIHVLCLLQFSDDEYRMLFETLDFKINYKYQDVENCPGTDIYHSEGHDSLSLYVF